MKIIRQSVLDKTNSKCGYCGCQITISTMEVDHIHPKSHGGNDEMENLMPACRSCNRYKLVFSLEEFRNEIALQVKRARESSLNFRLAERFGLIQETGKKVSFYFEREQRNEP